MWLSGFALRASIHPILVQISATKKEVEQKKQKKDARKGGFHLVRLFTIV